MIKMRIKRIILMSIVTLSVISCNENEKETEVRSLPSSHGGIIEGDAFHIEMQKAENGDAESMRSIAIHYESMGPDFSDLALKWMERAAEQGHLKARADILSSYLAHGRYKDAELLFEEMRESGQLEELEELFGNRYGDQEERWETSINAARRNKSNAKNSTTPKL